MIVVVCRICWEGKFEGSRTKGPEYMYVWRVQSAVLILVNQVGRPRLGGLSNSVIFGSHELIASGTNADWYLVV
jgi:hypothetical protein